MSTNWDFARLVLIDGGWPQTSDNETVIAQWMGSENYVSSWWTRNNPLNNGLGSGGGSGLGSYQDLPTAAYYVALNLYDGNFGYPAIVADLIASEPPATTATAIWASDWAGSHYGYGADWYSSIPPAVTAPQVDWGGEDFGTERPGTATDISIGADAKVWVVGTDHVYGGYGIYQWTGSGWHEVPGARSRSRSGHTAAPGSINSARQIFRRIGSTWHLQPGSANDISVGADGAVWVVGTYPVSGGYGIYQWTGRGWTQEPGGAVNVALGPTGVEWAINSDHEIYRNDSGGWQRIQGSAYEVSVGSNGSVWVVGTDTEPFGYGIYRWSAGNSSWSHAPGQAVAVAGTPNGEAWVLNSLHQIWSE